MTIVPDPRAVAPAVQSATLGILLAIGGGAALAATDALVKGLNTGIPAGQLMFWRGVFTLLCLAPLMVREGRSSWRVANPRGQAMRAGCFVIGSFLFIEALWRLPLVTANAISFFGPVIVAALAPLVLREPVGWRRWCAIMAGFVGVVVMLRPSPAGIQWVALFPLGTAISSALADLLTRRLSATDSPIAILFYTTLAVTLAGLVTLPFGWKALSLAEFVVLAGVGVSIFFAHLAIINAFRRAAATVVAPLKYLMLVWAALIGYFGWGEVPDLWTTVGSTIIIASGLYIFYRETVVRRRER